MDQEKSLVLLKLETMKNEPPTHIIQLINELVQTIPNRDESFNKLQRFLLDQWLFIETLEESDLLFTALFSIVYADIGRQPSMYFRNRYLENIGAVCSSKNINQKLLSDISIHWERVFEVIYSNSKHKIEAV